MTRHAALLSIARAAVDRVNPESMIKNTVTVYRDRFRIKTEETESVIDLRDFTRIIVLGAGKATAPMARAMEEILGPRLTGGVIAVKPGHASDLKTIRQVEAGHPIPDRGSMDAAYEIARLAVEADEKTLIINLISGGGSALLTLPITYGGRSLTLEDMRTATAALLKSGADIIEVNCIRKHLSGIKGGWLAKLAFPATVISLILSDVVGDDLQSIASGLTVPDTSTWRDAMEIVKRYGLEQRLPTPVMDVFAAGLKGELPDTPKPDSPAFGKVRNILIGSNAQALTAARGKGEELGFTTAVLTSRLTGEAREVAKVFAGIAQDMAASGMLCGKPACILAGGETTVTVRGGGKGGRNQEMALAFLEEIRRRPEAFAGVLFASLATDGNDGPTDAAGAFASFNLLSRAEAAGLSINDYLTDNDAYHFFDAVDGLIRTGPTNTNVCDVQILLIE